MAALAGFQRVFQLLGIERLVQDKAGAGFEGSAGARPNAPSQGEEHGFLRRGQKGRHTNDLFGAGQVEICDESRATPGKDRFQRLLLGETDHVFDGEFLERGFENLKRSWVVTQDNGRLGHEQQGKGRRRAGKVTAVIRKLVTEALF